MLRRLLALFALVLCFSLPAAAATFTVNDLGDADDNNTADNVCATAGAVCTLRAAITQANATAGADVIEFAASGTGTFLPATNYPTITEQLTIDGRTGNGYAGVPVIIVDGAGSSTVGFHFGPAANSSELIAVQVMGFSTAGVLVDSSNSTIRECYIGPIPMGTPNQDGIQLNGTDNRVGGSDSIGNVISGNSRYGINVTGTGHEIVDNLIGLAPTGLTVLGNLSDGINMSAASGVRIGSSDITEVNVISGNGGDGIELQGSDDNEIWGNFIGVDIDGANDLGNELHGIYLHSDADNNDIGNGDSGNVISGNGGNGVEIEEGTGNVVAGSNIGMDVTGMTAIGNGGVGVGVRDSGNTVGIVGSGNLISGNGSHGIDVAGQLPITSATILHNNIGLASDGMTGVGNTFAGINIILASNVVIGGAAGGNLISFNGTSGIDGTLLTTSSIEGNIIGLTADGTVARGNGLEGIALNGGGDVTIGATGARNVISGNSSAGITLLNGLGAAHIVQDNYIGTTGNGLAAEGNLGSGIEVVGTNGAIIRRNVVSANGMHGLDITVNSTGTQIYSNTIGLAANNTTPLGNTGDGVQVCDGAVNTVVGSVALGGNVISANDRGISTEPSALLGNTWAANSIFGNLQLGIDHSLDGVTENDPDDPDTGPNNLQNFPVILGAVSSATSSHINGIVNTNANTPITIHVYSNTAQDPSGNGEGESYVGTVSVLTNSFGNASWIINGPAIAVGRVVTATATAPEGTSEFSDFLAVSDAPVISFNPTTYPVAEGAGSVLVTVTRTGTPAQLAAISTVQYTTSDGTATAGSDYITEAGTLTFIAGDTTEQISVPITQDTLDENAETINLTLSNPNGATIGTGAATITINDDDNPPNITINDRALPEGNTTANVTFTISLSAPSGLPVSVTATTSPGTATAGSDYTTTGPTVVTIPAGSTTGTFDVPVIGDGAVEPDETYFVDLTLPVNGTVTDNQGQGTIQNDDVALSSNLSVSKVSSSPTFTPGQQLTFTITASNGGPDPAANVTVTDILPPGTTYVSATSAGSVCSGTTTVTCTAATLASGGSFTVTLVVTASGSAPIVNTATIASNNGDPVPGNNTAVATVNPAANASDIPSLSMWALLLLAALLGLAGTKLLR